jgi:hypothetical protein
LNNRCNWDFKILVLELLYENIKLIASSDISDFTVQLMLSSKGKKMLNVEFYFLLHTFELNEIYAKLFSTKKKKTSSFHP